MTEMPSLPASASPSRRSLAEVEMPLSAVDIAAAHEFPDEWFEQPDELRTDSQRFINRELSWLSFNARVLQEAENPNHPVLERLRFLAISGSNLDEFFMVRVAGLRALVRSGVTTPSQDGRTPKEQLLAINQVTGELVAAQQARWMSLRKEMEAAGIHVIMPEKVSERDRKMLAEVFENEIFPLLTPLAVDPAHPFPFIPNLGFALTYRLIGSKGRSMYSLVPVPTGVKRFIRLPNTKTQSGSRRRYIAIENVIDLFVSELFPGFETYASGAFRVIRDSDIEVEEEAEDLMEHLETALKRRRRGVIVRLEIDSRTPDEMADFIRREIEADPQHVARLDGFLGVKELDTLIADQKPELLFPPFEPRYPERVRDFGGDCFAAIRAKDMIVHHPYETFDVVVDFIAQAARDKDVLTIKQTLYRTSRSSPIVAALCEAADSGKNVTALVELKARFDEEANLQLARELERHGVQVVYGFMEYKTHAKLSLVVRREGDHLRAYTHVGTGNYHPFTARIYTDLSLFTANPAIARDAGRVFNYVTGYGEPREMEKMSVSPMSMKSDLIDHIDHEIANAQAGKPSGVWAKLNSLMHPEIIDKLYEASCAGVPIELVIRGICALRPGVPGLSENIRVKSVVGRFLEHARICAFANGAEMPSPRNLVYIASADWMPRNLDRRIEVMCPIINPTVHRQVLQQIMVANLRDEAQSWVLQPDGRYTRIAPDENNPAFNLHHYFMANPSLSGRGTAATDMPPKLKPE
jgi:polyphosphate kinase